MNRGANRRVVRSPGRPASYGRPVPPKSRRNRPEVKVNVRAIVGIIVIGLLIWGWWSIFLVKKVTVEGSSSYPASMVQEAAQGQLDKRWWWRNLTTLDTRKLQDSLLKAQPQLESVDISRRWPSRLNLKVTEREPNLAWRSGEETYLLSSEGIIVARAGEVGSKLPVVEDSTNLPVELGDRVVPARFVAFTLELIRLLPKQGEQITNIKVPDTTSEVYVETKNGYYLKFDTTRQASGEVGDLAKVLALLKSQGKKPTEYIDLRIEGKAYYK